MVNGVNSVSTMKIIPPQEYAKYEYEVIIDGKTQMAHVEKTENGRVTIKVGDGKDTKLIKTDSEGLIEFNKKYKPVDIIYNSKPEEKPREQQEVCSGKLAQIMKNIAVANMVIGAKANKDLQDYTSQQFQQQAIQDNLTAIQMSTPGMGII